MVPEKGMRCCIRKFTAQWEHLCMIGFLSSYEISPLAWRNFKGGCRHDQEAIKQTQIPVSGNHGYSRNRDVPFQGNKHCVGSLWCYGNIHAHSAIMTSACLVWNQVGTTKTTAPGTLGPNVCGEDQPVASHSSWRKAPDSKILGAAILLVEWAQTVKAEGWPATHMQERESLD